MAFAASSRPTLTLSSVRSFLFRSCTRVLTCSLLPIAPKAEVIAYLGLATSPTDLNPKSSGIKPKRRAEASLIDTLSGQVYVLACEIKNGQGHIDSFEEMPEGIQPAITMEELVESEEVVRNNPEVIRLCAEVGE